MSRRPFTHQHRFRRGGILAGGAILAIAGGLLVTPAGPAPASAAEPTPYATTEPQFWHSGFEHQTPADSAEWKVSGPSAWEFINRDVSLEKYGTDRRQAFSRASGTMAVAETAQAAFNGTLTSPAISLAATTGKPVEVRLDSHFLARGTRTASAKVTAVFDTGARTELAALGATDRESEQLRLQLNAPGGAKSVRLEFAYSAPVGSGSWRIDDVELVRPLAPLAQAAQPSAVVDVFSDVQGAQVRLRDRVIPGLRALRPAAKTIVSNGDLTPDGSPAEYTAYFDAYNTAVGDQYTTKISTIGNHELYSLDGSEAAITRFLDRTGMRALGVPGANPAHAGLWGETVVDGKLPVLWIGSEYYDFAGNVAGAPFVKLSDEQFSWLQGRLAHWRAQNTPVLLFTHHVLSHSVSGTHEAFYRGEFGTDEARYRALLGENPNVTVFNSHTHSSPGLGDWSVEQRFDPNVKHGPTIVNTISVNNEYQPFGDWGAAPVADTGSIGLRVGLYDDRLRVTAYRFGDGGAAQQVNQIDIARPTTGQDPESPVTPLPSPKLTLGAASVARGGTVPVNGTGFTAGEKLSIELSSTPKAAKPGTPAESAEAAASTKAAEAATRPAEAAQTVPTARAADAGAAADAAEPAAPSAEPRALAEAPLPVTADNAGAFSATLSVPVDAPIGQQNVIVHRADGTQLSAPLEVRAAAVQGGGTSGGTGNGTGTGTTPGATPGSGAAPSPSPNAHGVSKPGAPAGGGSGSRLAQTGGAELAGAGVMAALGVVAGGILLARRRRA